MAALAPVDRFALVVRALFGDECLYSMWSGGCMYVLFACPFV